MKKFATIFLFTILFCNWSVVSSASMVIDDFYVEGNMLHAFVTVTCGSVETRTEHQIELDGNCVPTNLPLGWSYVDECLTYSEVVSCEEGSFDLGNELCRFLKCFISDAK